ncbi:MAG: glycerol-3-phosphate acyltransferase [Lachnospiraceae bacterium]|nr:glycerol-3-phosphate acyltransferase [Lachnospiraceae bacterium]
MERIYCFLIGYVCGCFLTAEFVSKRYAGHGVQNGGPDNPGMASITIKFGIKAGLLVLAGDCLKTFLAIGICSLWLFKELGSLAVSYAGFGAVFGHCFPVSRHFHGGKGIAVTGAYSLSLSPLIWLITYVLGGVAALISGYLAIGSAVIAVLFPITTFLFGLTAEEVILTAITGVVILARHRKNFRLIHFGGERNFHFLKRIFRGK